MSQSREQSRARLMATMLDSLGESLMPASSLDRVPRGIPVISDNLSLVILRLLFNFLIRSR